MSWIDVTTEEFNDVMRKSIRLGRCPKCSNLGAELILNKEVYGRYSNSVRIKCTNCNYETETFNATYTYNDVGKPRIGTFVTRESIIPAIDRAIDAWNTGGGEDYEL